MSIDDLKIPSEEEREKIKKENQRIAMERAELYHRVFVQNKDGAKLLEAWFSQYVFGGFTPDTAGVTELAKTEARREFVCMIVGEINQVEG